MEIRKGPVCVGCGLDILDQYIFRVAPNHEWHSDCLKCFNCQISLNEDHTCYVRNGNVFCKNDYLRLFATKCDGCAGGFLKTEYVMRGSLNKIFHMDCFRCVICDKLLVPGDSFAHKDSGLFCQEHHASNSPYIVGPCEEENGGKEEEEPIKREKNKRSQLNEDEMEESGKTSINLKNDVINPSSRRSRVGRVRTVLTEKQLGILKSCYDANPRPDALFKEQMTELTGLSSRVIRVWFQNKRCKDKKKMNNHHHDKDGRKNHGNYSSVILPNETSRSDFISSSSFDFQGFVSSPWKGICEEFNAQSDTDKQNIINEIHDHEYIKDELMGNSPPTDSGGSFILPSDFGHSDEAHNIVQPNEDPTYTLTQLDSSNNSLIGGKA